MAVDMFLKLDGVDGDSTDKTHQGWIEVLSFSWGLSNPGEIGSGGGGGAGKVTLLPLNFVAAFSKASAQIEAACATGQHFKTADLVARKGGQPDFYKVHLDLVIVTAYQSGGSGDVPQDEVTLEYGSLQFGAGSGP